MSRVLLALTLVLAFGCGRAHRPEPAALVDDAGNAVTFTSTPVRVVSLIPATTELLFALGAGALLVGRTAWCDYPAQAAAVPNLGNGIEPNIEAVVGASPDLVLLYKSGSNRAAAQRFRSLGIPTLELATDRMVDFDRIARLLGAVLGRREAAESIITRTALELAQARVPAGAAPPPTVFILAWDRPPMTLGRGSFLSEIIEHAGGRNAFDDLAAASAPVSIEAVARRNPAFVLTTSEDEPGIATRSEWRVVRAVREKRFVRVHGSEFNRPSPRIAAAVRQLAKALAAAPR